MIRFARLALAAAIFVLLAATAANAAPRMWIGFHDDPSFRWRTDRSDNLDGATQVGSTVIRAWVYWPQIAPTRPANPSEPVRPGLPDGRPRRARPRRPGARRGDPVHDLGRAEVGERRQGRRTTRRRTTTTGETFCKAVATRYNGQHSGYPFVRFYSIWNEPNLNQFLAPQFTQGEAVEPGDLRQALPGRVRGDQGREPVARSSRPATPRRAAATSRSARARPRTRSPRATSPSSSPSRSP